MAGELTSDGRYIYTNTAMTEIYVPEEIVESPDDKVKPSSIAYEYGDGFVIFGICYIRFFKSEDMDRDAVQPKTLMYPNLIMTSPSESVKNVKLTINGIEDKYRVLKYYHGDVLMEASSRKSATNCEAFIKLLSAGKLPRSLRYDDVYAAWMDNYKINGMTPNVPAVMLQAIIAEMYRDPTDLSRQFSKVIGENPKVDPRAYIPLNMNAVSSYSSVASGMSFERMSEKITTSLVMTKDGTPQKPSPIEKVLRM